MIKAKTLEKIKQAVREVEIALVKRDYEKINSNSRKNRLSKEGVASALKDYGGKVTQAPEKAYKELKPVHIKDSIPNAWFVDFDLWIDGKQSDLTLSLTVTDQEKGDLLATIDDIHIL